MPARPFPEVHLGQIESQGSSLLHNCEIPASSESLPPKVHDMARPIRRKKRWSGVTQATFHTRDSRLTTGSNSPSSSGRKSVPRSKSFSYGADCSTWTGPPPSPSHSAQIFDISAWDLNCHFSPSKSRSTSSCPARCESNFGCKSYKLSQYRRSAMPLLTFDAQFERWLLILCVLAFVLTSVGILLQDRCRVR